MLRLARKMACSPRELLRRFDSVELAEQQAFDRLNPLDGVRRIETAIGLSTAANVAAHGGGSKTARDYMVEYGKRCRELFEAEQANAAIEANPAAAAARVAAMLDLYFK